MQLERKVIIIWLFMLMAVAVASVGSSSAALIGVGNTLELPTIQFNSQGAQFGDPPITTVYNAFSDELSIEANPVSFFLSLVPLEGGFVGSPSGLTIQVVVDDAGALVGGVPGDDLVVVGTVDLGALGTFSGVLLTGEVTEFGFEDSGTTTDFFDFRVQITGGSLAFLYPGGELGIPMESAGSNFIGSFVDDFEGGAKGNIGGQPVATCELGVEKTCCIPPPSLPGADDCQGKVISMVLEYTGDTCASLTNDQEGKAKCSGLLDGDEPVQIVYTGKDPDKISVTSASISVGETFSVVATGRNELHANTKLEIVSGDLVLLQALEIHTSCSKALTVGDQFGSLRVVEMETTEGGITTLPDPDAEPAEPGSACVSPNFPEETRCDSRLIEAVFQYVGAGCEDPLANPQDGKAMCSGNPVLAQPVSVAYTGKDPDKISVSPASSINLGETFRVTATGRNELHSNTKLQITSGADILQALEIHTSCSETLALGDVFGGLRVVEFTTKDGGVKALGDPDAPIFFETCEVPTASAGPHCTSKVAELTLRYLGGECSETTNSQGGKFECLGDNPGDDLDVMITKDADQVTASPDMGISVGDLVSFTPSGRELRAETRFEVMGTDGTQSLTIHTSCSQPLNLGDRFGAFEVFAINRKDDGFVSLGGQVEYQYTVTNPNAGEVGNVTVDDDVLGEIASGLLIPGGQSVTFFKTATLFDTTTNTVTVTGTQNALQCAEAEASVTVNVVEPPPGPFVCTKPIDVLTMIWDGTDTINVEAFKGPVGSTSLGTATVAPGEEVTFSGFAGSPNDVFWLLTTSTSAPFGDSKFHLSCSDKDMNGPEDCGKLQGDGKEKDVSPFINDWIFEGMVDESGSLDCTPSP